ncbi:MAG TPA: hypothetical protein VJT83_10120 [Chitinophagaceae bacterium]|nr:hypothetical protein [Chitinophagaceae bacterium]
MKRSFALNKATLLLIAVVFLFSCKKQINKPGTNELPAVSIPSNINCKASNFAVMVEFPNQFQQWHNLMQRWYGTDGKISHIKAMMSPHFNEFAEFTHKLEYGEVTYPAPNQIRVRDVLRDRLVMRVTLDPSGKPEASYYYNIPLPNQIGEIDTTYYHYVGGRLDHIFHIQQFLQGPDLANALPARFTRYNFIYDMYGNLIRMESGNSQGSFKMHITYDYSKPITDMMTAHYVLYDLRLLDYLDVLHMPVHHQPVQVWEGAYDPGSVYPYETYPIEIFDYANFSMLPNGLVWKYNDTEGYSKKTYYTGWDCDDAIITSAAKDKAKPIETFEAFKKRYPSSLKDK